MAQTNTSTQNKQNNQIVIRNTSNLNNKFKEYGKNKKIQNIKNVFKNRGTLGTDFRKVFRFLKVYQNIVNQLLNKPEFMKYYTDTNTNINSRASILTLLKKFYTYIEPNTVIKLEPYEIKNLPINENNLNLNEYGLEEIMYEFLKGTQIPEEIKNFSPINYIRDIPEYWEFLDNSLDKKDLYLMDKLEKNNYVSQTGGTDPRKYYLDNASNKKEIQKYINDCSQNEYLYALKHIEYIQLFLFLKELVACNLNLNMSLQTILKIKFYNDEGNPIEIGDMLSVQLPKKQDFKKFLEQQKNVLDSTTRQYLGVLGDDKIDMIINDIYNQIINEVKQILESQQNEQQGGLRNVRKEYGNKLKEINNNKKQQIQNKINEKLQKLLINLQNKFEKLSNNNLNKGTTKRNGMKNIFGNNIDKIFNDILSNREKKREQEQAERKAKEEAERKAKEEAEKKAREELDRKAKEEKIKKIETELNPFKNNIIQKYQEIKKLEEIKDDFFVLDQIYNIYKYIETNNLDDKLSLFDVKIDGENSLAQLLEEIYKSNTLVDLSKKREINNLIKEKGGLSMTLGKGEGEEVIDINELKEEVYKIPGIIVKISDPYQLYNKDKNYNIKDIQSEYNERVRANDKNCVIIGKKCYGDGDAKPYGVYRKVVQPDSNGNPKNKSLYDYMINDYNLANTISKGNHLKFFGYGFSGSGKTYTLLQGGKDDPSILSHLLIDLKNGNLKNNEDKVLEFNSLSIKVYYPLMDYDKTDTNEFYVNKDRSNIKTQLDNISKNLNQEITSESNNNLSVFVKENLEEVEKILNDNLLILPTTNNPNSSRAFTIVEVGIKDSGSVTFIDLPGLEKKVDMIRDHYISLPENESGTLNKYIQKQINSKKNITYDNFISNYEKKVTEFFTSYNFLYPTIHINDISKFLNNNIKIKETQTGINYDIKFILNKSFFNDQENNKKILCSILKTYYKLEKITIEKFFQKDEDEEQNKNKNKISLIYQNYVIDILNYINYQTNLFKDYVYELPHDVSTFINTFKNKFLNREDFKLKDKDGSQIQKTIKEILYGEDYESILFNIFKISKDKDKKDSYFTLFNENNFNKKFPNNGKINVHIYKNPALTVLNALFSLIDNEKPTKISYSKLQLVFLVMYTKFTLDQGGAIVSSLEHLLFLFLNQIPEGVNKYNDKHKDRPFEKFQNNTYGESTYDETVNSGMVESIMRKPSKGMNKILGIGNNEVNQKLRFINLLTILRAEYDELKKETYTDETIKQKRCQGAKETVDFGSTLVMADNNGCGGTEIKSDIQIKNNSKEKHNTLQNELDTIIKTFNNKINKLNNEDMKSNYSKFIAQIKNRTFTPQITNQTGGKTKSLKNRIRHRHTKNPSKKNRFYKGGANANNNNSSTQHNNNSSTQQNEFNLKEMAQKKIKELFPNIEENENQKRINLLIKKLKSVLENEKITDKDTTYKLKILDKYLEALKIENFKSVADNANTVGTIEERNFIHRKSKTVENFGKTLETIHDKFITDNIKDILNLKEKLDLTQLQVQSGGQNNNLNNKLTQLEELMRKIEDLKNKQKQVQEEEVQEEEVQETQETQEQTNTPEQKNTPEQTTNKQETNTQEQTNTAKNPEEKKTYANVVKTTSENLAEAATLASGQKGGNFLEVKNENSTKKLQTFLDRCYNLQNLYLIKHYEVMEILKPIVYYLDVLGKNTLLFVYVLSMYGKEETISGETLEKEISFLPQYQNFITKINDLLKDQKKINVIMKDIKDIKKDEKGLNNQTKDAKLGNSTSIQEGGKLNKTKKNQKNKKKNTQKGKLSKKNRSK